VSKLIRCEQQSHIATLTINRPEKRNAMSPEMLLAMRDYMQRLQAAGETRVLIIRGEGTEEVLTMVQSYQDFAPHHEAMSRLRAVCMHSDDFQEGRRAFLEKRAPEFQGR